MKKLITISLSALLLVSLAGCGNSNNTSSDTSSKSSKVAKDSSSNSKSSNKANSKSSSKAESNSSSSSDSNSVDTTNLSNAQAVAWIQANMNSTVLAAYNTGNNKFTAEDFLYNNNGSTGPAGVTEGAIYYQIRENHNSANMQAAGADANTAPSAGWFRITSGGELQYMASDSSSWTTVSSSYNA